MDTKNDTPIRWKVVASKSYFWGKKIMKPGQIFTAFEKDIPANFRPMIIPFPLDTFIETQKSSSFFKKPEEVKEEKEIVIPTPAPYRAKEYHGGLYWNVVDAKGKIINEQKLTKEEAIQMVRTLTL